MHQAFGSIHINGKRYIASTIFLSLLVIAAGSGLAAGLFPSLLPGVLSSDTGVTKAIQTVPTDTRAYLDGKIDASQLMMQYEALSHQTAGPYLPDQLSQMKRWLSELEALRQINERITNRLNQFMDGTATPSAAAMVPLNLRLSEMRELNNGPGVYTPEMVPAGSGATLIAGVGTLSENPDETVQNEGALFPWVQSRLADLEEEMRVLTHRPADIPEKETRIAELTVKHLTLTYILNIERMFTRQQAIFDGIEHSMAGVEKAAGDRRASRIILFAFLGIVVAVVILTAASALKRRTEPTVPAESMACDETVRPAVACSIEEVAFETNILALNAAIEASRAADTAEGGEDLATVAKEARHLAMRASVAAIDSTGLIGEMNSESPDIG